jgi:hypothetical protein
MTLEYFLAVLVLSGAGAYILNALELERKNSHEGPFKSDSKVVVFPQQEHYDSAAVETWIETEHRQAVALWDWLRRLDGVYRVEGNEWHVIPKRAERWTCSFCLSFWTTLPLTIFFTVVTGLWMWFFVVHLATAVLSVMIKRWAFGE